MNETDNQPQDLPEYLREQEPDLTGNATFLSEETLAESPTLPEDSSTTSTSDSDISGENPPADAPQTIPTGTEGESPAEPPGEYPDGGEEDNMPPVPATPVAAENPGADAPQTTPVPATNEVENPADSAVLASSAPESSEDAAPEPLNSSGGTADETPAAPSEAPHESTPPPAATTEDETPVVSEVATSTDDATNETPDMSEPPASSDDSGDKASDATPAAVLSPYPQPELPQVDQSASSSQPEPPAASADSDLETTVVRRKSLLGGQSTETIAPRNPQSNETEEPQWQPRPAQLLGGEDPQLNEATVLAGASIKPAKISRVGAHFASLLTCLLALPFAWAFLKHAHGLLYAADKSTWETGHYSIEGLSYLILGLALIVMMGLAVRLSSLGPFLVGILVTLGGLSFVVMPVFMKNNLDPTLTWLSNSKLIPFQNLSYFLESSGFSGDFLAIGVALLMIGIVGHTARRRGRTDQIADKALAKTEALQ